MLSDVIGSADLRVHPIGTTIRCFLSLLSLAAFSRCFLTPDRTVHLPDDSDLDDDVDNGLGNDPLLGDGIADTDALIYCPYCGEEVEIAIDPGGGATQEYVEDCQVCCQPWRVTVRYASDGSAEVSVSGLEE